MFDENGSLLTFGPKIDFGKLQLSGFVFRAPRDKERSWHHACQPRLHTSHMWPEKWSGFVELSQIVE